MNQDYRFFKVYGHIFKSCYDLSIFGVEEIFSHEHEISPYITIKKSKINFNTLNYFVDNQTSVDEKYGYYYKKNLAFFEFLNGSEIRVSESSKNDTFDFIRVLLNYPIACIFFQKNFFLLHASSVTYRNKVFIFPGSSTSGKSTCAASLVKSGARLITEDTAVINILKNKNLIFPSYPLIKLSSEANKFINLSINQGIFFASEKNKRKGHLIEYNKFQKKKLKIDYCFFLKWSNNPCSRIYSPNSSEVLSLILSSSLSIHPLTSQKELNLLKSNANFLKNIKTFVFERNKAFDNLKIFKKLLDDLINAK